MTTIKSYRDLVVWQRAMEVAVEVYRLTENFPKSEQYGLTSQMRRAAVSIASNIAEGHGRTNRHFGVYLGHSLGSLAELETQAEISRRIGFLQPLQYQELSNHLDSLGRQLNVLRQKVDAAPDS